MALDPAALDRHITGNYGEDFFKDIPEDDDLETCSWCTTEVPDSSLTELDDGARICPSCAKELAQAEDPESCKCGHPECGAC